DRHAGNALQHFGDRVVRQLAGFVSDDRVDDRFAPPLAVRGGLQGSAAAGDDNGSGWAGDRSARSRPRGRRLILRCGPRRSSGARRQQRDPRNTGSSDAKRLGPPTIPPSSNNFCPPLPVSLPPPKTSPPFAGQSCPAVSL